MGKGRKYTPKECESSKHGGADKFAGIYMSMVDSQAWSELTANQRVLYVYFKLQIHDKYLKSEYGDLAFTFNRGKWRDKYGLYRDGNQQGFYRDRDALIEKGFVDCVKCGQRTKEKSVYRLSDRWQHYGLSHTSNAQILYGSPYNPEAGEAWGCMEISPTVRRNREAGCIDIYTHL